MVSKQESRIYYIEKGRLIFVENDLDNPNRIAVSVSSGTTIQVYDESLIGFMSDGKFYSWTLKGFSTKLAKNDAYYIYARLDRTGVDALVVFSINQYNLDGSRANAPEGEENPPSDQYYYVRIGEVTATDGTTNREVTYDSGMLGTTKDVYENAGAAQLNEMFELNKTSDPWYIIVKHYFYDLTIKRSLKLIGSLIWGGKELKGVHTTEDIANQTTPDDEHLATSAYTQQFGDKRYLRKDQDDRTEHSLGIGKDLTVGGSQAVRGDQTVGGNQTVDGTSLVKGLLSLLTGAASPDFIAGLLGTGFELRKDEETGRWRLEIDELVTRVRAIFYELVIQKMKHIGGALVLSPGSMSCVRVEETEDAYRCYFKATDGERSVKQEFEVGDLARSQSFNLKALDGGGVGTSFYWRLVTAVGEDWIELSKTHCAEGSGIPQAGDDIVQMGNLTDSSRQNATILDTTGSDAPSIKQYRGINGYVLNDDMAITIFSSKLNRIRGQFISEVTGKDVDESLKDIQVDLETVKAQSDREFTIWFFEVNPTTENLPASAWTTDAMKREHVEDIYYNREAGLAWRWMATDDGGYYWEDIKDQQTLRALEKASRAQDTADSKRRTFVAQPTDADAYDVGDQWVNVTYPVGETDEEKLVYKNDALVCIQAKPAGVSFNISHWRATTENTTREIKAKMEILEKSITSSVGSDNAARDEAIKKAKEAAEGALIAAGNADGKAGTAILQTQNYISAMSAYFEYDKEGNVVSVKSGGLLLTSDFATMFSEAVDKSGIVKRAEISTMVTKDEKGNLESGVKISADQINMTGTAQFYSKDAADSMAQGKVDALKGLLKGLAYKDKVGLEHMDGTVIDGGKILTSLIKADELQVKSVHAENSDGTTTCHIDGKTGKLTAKNAEFEGKIAATSGTVGGFAIGNGVIGTELGDYTPINDKNYMSLSHSGFSTRREMVDMDTNNMLRGYKDYSNISPGSIICHQEYTGSLFPSSDACAAEFICNKYGLKVSASGIFKTSDGGKTWVEL